MCPCPLCVRSKVSCWGSNVHCARVKTLSLQEQGSRQIQCTSWRDFAPFTTSTFIDILSPKSYIHASEQAWENAGDRQWVRNT
jgi:hypothetical protein